jgi:dTDP-4-amino-4,6-dideoxygalactose transaminase
MSEKPERGFDPSGYFATALPLLRPGMLVPRPRPRQQHVPFSRTDAHYFYLARNAIFALAEAWELADQEVLFPAYFHGVELEALLAAGVRPKFYPVHSGMRIDPDEVVSRITDRTRAVYLIHYLGIPGPVRELAAACREREVPLIEDCALALLSSLGDQPLGTFGDAAIFCLYKTLPVPNGGALIMRPDDESTIRTEAPPLRAALSNMAGSLKATLQDNGGPLMRWALRSGVSLGRRAVQTADLERVEVGSQTFDPAHARLGMNRFGHLVIGNQDLDTIVESRRRNFLRLAERLRPLGASLFETLGDGTCPLFFPIRTHRKAELLQGLEARGIQAVNFWSVRLPITPRGEWPEVDEMRETIVELPCHQDLTEAHIDRIAAVVLELQSLVVRRAA